MAKSLFLVASLLLLLPLSLAKAEKQPLIGQYQDIGNIDNYIQHLGHFAVVEYNNKTNSHLGFEKVIGGKYQVVAGTNYDLRLFAFDGPTRSLYRAILNVDLNEKRTLNKFSPIKFKN